MAPAAQGGRRGYAVGIFERWGRVFPRTLLHKAPPHRLAACNQTEVGVGQGESREKAYRHTAVLALTAAVSDPVVAIIMRLLGSPAVTVDGIVLTRGTQSKQLTRTSCPIQAGLAIIRRTWDKSNRSCSGLFH